MFESDLEDISRHFRRSVPENNATECAIPFRAFPWNNGNPTFYSNNFLLFVLLCIALLLPICLVLVTVLYVCLIVGSTFADLSSLYDHRYSIPTGIGNGDSRTNISVSRMT